MQRVQQRGVRQCGGFYACKGDGVSLRSPEGWVAEAGVSGGFKAVRWRGVGRLCVGVAERAIGGARKCVLSIAPLILQCVLMSVFTETRKSGSETARRGSCPANSSRRLFGRSECKQISWRSM